MYIDKDKMEWAKYTNLLGTRFYTAEEMLERMGVTEEEEQQKREEWRKQMGYPGY